MPDFSDSFWGEKNNGFHVLFNNFKHGQTSTKEFLDFLRESCTVEENYSKLLSKLAKNISSNTCLGTFAPFWNLLKVFAEKLSTLNLQLVLSWTDLIKDVSRYHEDQHKKYKTIKDGEAPTREVVQLMQQITISLHQSREIYHTRCLELEKLKRENASPKDIEKAELRSKKACEDYRNYIDKYAAARSDFETKMLSSCQNLQDVEEKHLLQMKDFVETYYKAWENHHAKIGQVHSELQQNCNEQSVEALISAFVTAKTTGTERPRAFEFEEADISQLPIIVSPINTSITNRNDINLDSRTESIDNPENSDQPGPLSRSVKLRVSRTWFLKKQKRKGKKTKKKDKDTESTGTAASLEEGGGTVVNHDGLQVDEEGFTIRPDNISDNVDKTSWCSSSDSDSDMDDHKFRVEIRPLSANGISSGTVEDIRASVDALRISPTIAKKRSTPLNGDKLRRSQSVSDTLDKTDESSVLGTSYNWSLAAPSNDQSSFTSPFEPLDIKSIETDVKPTEHSAQNWAFSSNFSDMKEHTILTLPNKLNIKDTSLSSKQSKLNHSSSVSTHRTSLHETLPILMKPPSKVHSDQTSGSKQQTRPNPRLSLPKDTSVLDDENLLVFDNITTTTASRPSTVDSPSISSPGSLKSPLSNDSFSFANSSSFNESYVSDSSKSSSLPSNRQRPLSQMKQWSKVNKPIAFSKEVTSNSTTFNTTPSIFSSRGPSPLTVGKSDNIPIAVAFTETINAYFRGTDASKCIVKLTGGLMISFPAGIVRAFIENPSLSPLTFSVSSTTQLENVTLNTGLLSQDISQSSETDLVYAFNILNLSEHLRQQAEVNKSAAYFNVDILKYQVKITDGVESTPLPLVCYWKCENHQTDYRLDYKYNSNAVRTSSVLKNVSAAVIIDGDVTNMQSIPSGSWLSDQKRATWKLNDVSDTLEHTYGSIRAKFHVNNGPTIPSATAIQFSCEGSTLSGVDFRLLGSGYRLSLTKKRFGTGRYLVEPVNFSLSSNA